MITTDQDVLRSVRNVLRAVESWLLSARIDQGDYAELVGACEALKILSGAAGVLIDDDDDDASIKTLLEAASRQAVSVLDRVMATGAKLTFANLSSN
jgi:hypothetical protein